ncbi:MAG: dockerin type I repeat-containing protein [Clostridia bacterium]|nr:dockerin type I repeat-containing protein [Clostridia bacterium]
MKRFLSLLLALALVLSLAPMSFGTLTVGKYIVTANVAEVFTSPTAREKISEVTKNTYLQITEILDGYGKAYIAKDDSTGWINMAYLSPVTNAPDANITGIKIKALPYKTVYIDGKEELDLTGLTVVATKTDNSETPVKSYSVYAPEMKIPGEKTVKITYSPNGNNIFEASFTVTVKRVSVKSISLVNEPKKDYLENQSLDLSELLVRTEFENSAENTVLTFEQIKNNGDYIITGCHGEAHGSILPEGQHTIRINYKYSDINCEFTVNVAPRKLISLTVKQNPKNLTVYDNKNIPSLDGLILEASYDNGEKEDIYHYSCKAVCDPSKFVIGPGNMVDVYFGEMYVTLSFHYSIAVPEKIVLEYPIIDGVPFPLTFLKGEEIDLSPIKVKLLYTDGTSQYVNDFTMTKPDYKIIGTGQDIIVKYKEFSEVFKITVSPYFSKGDINGDGIVRADDARQVLRASVNLTTLAGKTFFAGDTDRNGKISAMDARLILRACVNLENLYITI